MSKSRLETFSDGVLAIVITIMVLEMEAPHDFNWLALRPVLPVFMSYVLSFVYIGIYWNNHHHLFHAVRRVNGRILWANLHLLFWLTLVPFVTRWMGETDFARVPVSLYGIVLLSAAIAYTILLRALLAHHGKDSELAQAVGSDRKGKVSLALYAAAIPLAYVSALIAWTIYLVVVIIWLVPDPRIERRIGELHA